MSDFQEQLIDLQTRVAYQEDTLEQLNQVITQQDTEIVQLKQQIRILAQRLEDSLRICVTPIHRAIRRRTCRATNTRCKYCQGYLQKALSPV